MMIGGRLCLPPPNGHTRRHDTLSEIYTVPKQSLLRKYGGRIAGGLACAAVVSLVMHLTPVIEGIRWTGEIIRVAVGRPAVLNHLPKGPVMKKKMEVAIDKAREIMHDHKPSAPKVAAPVVKAAPIVASVVASPVVKKIEAIEQKIEKKEEKLANAIKGAGNKVKGVGDRIAQRLHDRKVEKDQAKYEQLKVRARGLGITVDDTWTLARLEAEVNQVEDVRWKRRYNAQCPYCHHPARIRESGKRERFGCLRCHNIFSGGTARALGAPPRPQPSGGWRLPF